MSQQTTEMSGINILADIFKTLQRLETRLEGQDSRLGTIEFSIRSGTASPTPDGPFVHSPATDKQLPKLPSPLTPPSPQAQSPSSKYEVSIQKLRKRFELIDDSSSDLNDAALESLQDCVQYGEHIFPRLAADRPNSPDSSMPKKKTSPYGMLHMDNDDEDDAYTGSIYSSRPLSRFDLYVDTTTMPPLPHATQLRERFQHNDGIGSSPTAVSDDNKPGSVTVPVYHTQYKATSASSVSRSYSQKPSSSERSRSSPSLTGSKRAHERVEMAYLAYDNFKNSLRSSVSLRSKERYAIRDEKRRLEDLAIPVAHYGTTSMSHLPKNRNEKWISTLSRFFYRLVASATTQ